MDHSERASSTAVADGSSVPLSLYPYSECFAARSHPRLRDADRGIKGIAPTSPIDAELRTICIEMVAPHRNNEK